MNKITILSTFFFQLTNYDLINTVKQKSTKILKTVTLIQSINISKKEEIQKIDKLKMSNFYWKKFCIQIKETQAGIKHSKELEFI